jgi:hypothetical protein
MRTQSFGSMSFSDDVLIVAALGLALSGCSMDVVGLDGGQTSTADDSGITDVDSRDAQPSPDALGLDPASFCQARAEVLAQLSWSCFGGELGYWVDLYRLGLRYPTGCGGVNEDSIRSGRQRWNGGEAQACIDQFRRVGCDVLLFKHDATRLVHESCSGLVEGLVPPGGVCANHGECGGSSYCDDDLAGRSCAHVCVERPLREPGDSCDAFTDSCSLGTACINGLCTPVGLGQLGAPCTSSRVCDASLTCDGRRCIPKADDGEPCPSLGEAYGSSDACSGPKSICLEQSRRLGVCAPLAQLGEPCDPAIPNCPPSSHCASVLGSTAASCRPDLLLGEPCQPNAGECFATLYCGQATGVGFRCLLRTRTGEPCTSQSCEGTASCIDGFCRNVTCER